MQLREDLENSWKRGFWELVIYLLFGPWPIGGLKILWYDRLALVLAIIGGIVYGGKLSEIGVNDYILLCFTIFAYLYGRATVKLAHQTELLVNETRELARKKK